MLLESLDDSWRQIAGDFLTALLAESLREKEPGAAILYDVRASRAVRDVVERERAGGRALMNRVGHLESLVSEEHMAERRDEVLGLIRGEGNASRRTGSMGRMRRPEVRAAARRRPLEAEEREGPRAPARLTIAE